MQSDGRATVSEVDSTEERGDGGAAAGVGAGGVGEVDSREVEGRKGDCKYWGGEKGYCGEEEEEGAEGHDR